MLLPAFNLGWKIAAVLNGTSDRSIPQDLPVRTSTNSSRSHSLRPQVLMDEAGISMDEFKDAFEKGNLFASGGAVDYGASLIVAKAGDAAEQGDGTDVSQKQKSLRVVGKQELASNVKIGMRMPSFKVSNHSDARPWHFQERLKSDGRWRLVVFAGDISKAK
jgi:phenol 2-monooxygenase